MSVITEQRVPSQRADEVVATQLVGTRRIGMGATGLLIVLLGAWGAIIPYIGPAFSYSANGNGSWAWTSAHTWLFLLPGIAAVVGGLLLLSGRPASVTASVAALLVLAAAAWFVVGPAAWPVLNHGAFFRHAATVKNLWYLIGYSMGPGVLLAFLGGVALGNARRAVVLS
jgi:hypothetical protein